MKSAPTQKALFIRSQEDDIVRADKSWMTSIGNSLACPRRSHLGRAWRQHPTPVDILLRREPAGVKASCFELDVSFFRRDLYILLRPYMKGILVGRVKIALAGCVARCPDARAKWSAWTMMHSLTTVGFMITAHESD